MMIGVVEVIQSYMLMPIGVRDSGISDLLKVGNLGNNIETPYAP
jgi:hypothetical protein